MTTVCGLCLETFKSPEAAEKHYLRKHGDFVGLARQVELALDRSLEHPALVPIRVQK